MNEKSLRCMWTRFVLLSFVFLLTGCIHSDAPLSDPDKSTPDEKLLGNWNLEEKTIGLRQITIEKVAVAGYPPGLMRLTSRSLKDAGQPAQVGFVFSSGLKEKTYLNQCKKTFELPAQMPAWDKLRAGGFYICKYAVKKDTLTFWFVDESLLKTAVKNGILKGTIGPQGYLDFEPTVHLQDTTASVARFVNDEDEKLFPGGQGKFVLKRVK